jgi:hypothetical protein
MATNGMMILDIVGLLADGRMHRRAVCAWRGIK